MGWRAGLGALAAAVVALAVSRHGRLYINMRLVNLLLCVSTYLLSLTILLGSSTMVA